MEQLQTDRLNFRLWRETDHPTLAEFYRHDANARFVGGVKSFEDSWRVLAIYLGHYQLKGFSYLALETRDTQTLVGTIGLWKSAAWPEHELGYWLLPEAQGKGYGVEAGQAALQYAKEISLPSLVSYIDPANEPSQKLATRLGATLDSTIELLDYGLHHVFRHW